MDDTSYHFGSDSVRFFNAFPREIAIPTPNRTMKINRSLLSRVAFLAFAAGASGNAQARLLSQPLPVLPDDLREDGYQAVAVARFLVHADGTFDIDLVKPTPNPRLNQILLETLRRWRFFPAMDNGRPVESRQDVRVHFNVN
ncbi:hypothetical protein WL76_18750 [Burkholderia ubonensis]|nr:hypothetical protein WL76_18750 [Burkholderia ubonensis]KWE56961.1 hypothetical protein WL77_29575 [Burkholderia ubonensis]KWE69049.1 hypothetical protein WL79_23685 [Burkholderia ubonensis]